MYEEESSSRLKSSLNPIAIQCDDYSLDYLQLDPIDRVVYRVAGMFQHVLLINNTINILQDERDAIQKKTFTKWVNNYLKKVILRAF